MTDAQLDVSLSESDAERNTRRWLRWFIIIGIVVMVLSAGGWFVADTVYGKSPKNTYLLAEWKTLTARVQSAGHAQDLELSQALAERAHDFVVEMTADIDASFFDEYDRKDSKVLRELVLRLTGKRHPTDRWAEYIAQLVRRGDAVVDLGVSIDPETVAVSSTELFDNSYYVRKDELRDWVNELRELEDQYALQEPIDELFRLTEEEMAGLRSRYGTFLYDHLLEEYFTFEDDVNITTVDGTVRGKKITIELGSKELRTLLIAFVDQIRADRELQKILGDRVYAFLLLNDESLEIDREYLSEIIEDSFYQLKQEVLDLRSLGKLKVEAYLTKGDVIAERKISYETRISDAKVKLEVRTTDWTSKDRGLQRDMKLTLEVEGRYDSVLIEFKSSEETMKRADVVERDGEYELLIRENGETLLEAELEVQASEAAKENGVDRYVFELRLDGADDLREAKPKVVGDMRIERSQDLGKSYAYREGDLSLELTASHYDGEDELVNLQFGVKFDVKFDDNLRKEELSDSAISILDMDDEELGDLLLEIGQALYRQLSQIAD